MLREESTIGRGEGEPSLVDAIFSSDGIVWAVLPGQRQLCLDRIAALEERVARALTGVRVLDSEPPGSQGAGLTRSCAGS